MVDLVIEKLPVSISLGLWTTLIIYLVCIPLGIAKAVRDGTPFDVWTSIVIIVGSAIPGYPVRRPADRAVRRRQLSSNGSRCSDLTSAELGRHDAGRSRIVDYFWHMALPLTAW